MLFFNETEDKLIAPFMHYFNIHPNKYVLLEWKDDTKIIARLDTAGESQNELSEEEMGFEEYFECIMETVKIISIARPLSGTLKWAGFLRSITTTSPTLSGTKTATSCWRKVFY